jgi:hypothetical protein
MRNSSESGIALLTTILVLMLMSALLVGFTTLVISDQRYRFIDRDRGQAFYAASGAIEKLTGDLGNLFLANVAPTAAQITALTAAGKQPSIAGISYASVNTPAPLPAGLLSAYYCSAAGKSLQIVGTNGYTIRFCASAAGNPTTSDLPLPIKAGPYEGLIALQTPYQLDVNAQTSTGGEVHLSRTIEAVAIPVFQFGIFSDGDLSFFAEQNFGFGGRIHTNSNLFLAEAFGVTLTTNAKVTAVGDVVRQFLSNGESIDNVFMIGTVSMATSAASPVANRNLLRTEGSVTGMPGSGAYANWQTLSLGATPANYNGYLRNHSTGAKKLRLPLTASGVGGTNQDLIKRPAIGEDPASILFNERLFSKASLRILLSDTAADITNLPGISAGAPVSLDWSVTPPAGYGPVTLAGATAIPPVALSPGSITMTAGNPASGGGGLINVVNGAGTVGSFKPTFTLAGYPGNIISCTGKATATPWNLTGCTGVPAMPPITAGLVLTAVSRSGGSVGASALTLSSGLSTITFVSQALLNTFNPLPFWDASAGVQVTCTGYTATTYTGCSSNPANNAVLVSAAMSNAGIGLLGGFIKIDRQNPDSSWTDVTLEILNYGIGANNLGGAFCGGAATWDPTPNAILRLQRLRDNGGAGGGGCNYNTDATGAKDPTNWWPNALFDTRESALRDDPALSTMTLGGVMYYASLDAKNLAKWFRAAAPYAAPAGSGVKTDNGGYTVYFSDRRNNRNAANTETGEYGWEDFVNPGVAGGTPNGVLDPGEDINGNLALDVYGALRNYNAASNTVPPCTNVPTCATVYGAAATTGYVLNTAATPTTTLTRRTAQVNRPILFRRALKLINGAFLNSLPTVAAERITGLTVVSENPVYIQGDWNAASTFLVADPHAATAIIADSVSILSSAWNDNLSFANPFMPVAGGRLRAAQSYYRVAVLAGKGSNFARPSDVAVGSVFGTDGGVHNFLRMLEGDTGAATTVNYRGSMATLTYSRQAVGTFKCCSGTAANGIVYSVPVRNFNFDTDFLNPALLPPNSPVFRDMNAVGFSQELRPGK